MNGFLLIVSVIDMIVSFVQYQTGEVDKAIFWAIWSIGYLIVATIK